MIKPYFALVFTCLFIPTLATAKTVDWSDYLVGMKADCDTYNLDKAIPANLKPSIAKIVNHRKLDDGTYIGKRVIALKNATAFGYPITKIVLDSTGYVGSTDIYFANSDFMKLRNQFYLNTKEGKLYASEKRKVIDPDSFDGVLTADGNGYDTGLAALTFDLKGKSISCSWAAA